MLEQSVSIEYAIVASRIHIHIFVVWFFFYTSQFVEITFCFRRRTAVQLFSINCRTRNHQIITSIMPSKHSSCQLVSGRAVTVSN